jgi:hypothetical protein
MPQAVLDNPERFAELPQEVINNLKNDLKLSARLCTFRQQVDSLREKTGEPNISDDDKNRLRRKITDLNNRIMEAVAQYDSVFKQIVSQEVYDGYYMITSDDSGKVVDRENLMATQMLEFFYTTRIIGSTTFCAYQARNGARLKSFLVYILTKHSIKTFNETILKRRENKQKILESAQQEEHSNNIRTIAGETGKSIGTGAGLSVVHTQDGGRIIVPGINQVEQTDQQNLLKSIIEEALDRLSATNEEEAEVVRLWMQGVAYKDIARLRLDRMPSQDRPEVIDSDDFFTKTADSLRHQRKRAMPKLLKIISIIASRKNLALDNEFSFVDLDKKFITEQKLLCDIIIKEALEQFSKNKQKDASEAKDILTACSHADIISLFGYYEGTKITTKRSSVINALHKVVWAVLNEKKMIMTLEGSIPIIKKI